jgi:hypothetical protein
VEHSTTAASEPLLAGAKRPRSALEGETADGDSSLQGDHKQLRGLNLDSTSVSLTCMTASTATTGATDYEGALPPSCRVAEKGPPAAGGEAAGSVHVEAVVVAGSPAKAVVEAGEGVVAPKLQAPLPQPSLERSSYTATKQELHSLASAGAM